MTHGFNHMMDTDKHEMQNDSVREVYHLERSQSILSHITFHVPHPKNLCFL